VAVPVLRLILSLSFSLYLVGLAPLSSAIAASDDNRFQQHIAKVTGCGQQLLLLKQMAMTRSPNLNAAAFDDVMAQVNAQLPDDRPVTAAAFQLDQAALDDCKAAFVDQQYIAIMSELANGADDAALTRAAQQCLIGQTQRLGIATGQGLAQNARRHQAITMIEAISKSLAFLDELTRNSSGEEWLNYQRRLFTDYMALAAMRVHVPGQAFTDKGAAQTPDLSECQQIGVNPASADQHAPSSYTSPQAHRADAVSCLQGLMYTNLLITDHFTDVSYPPSGDFIDQIARTYEIGQSNVPFVASDAGLASCPHVGVRRAHIDILTTIMTGHNIQQTKDVLHTCGVGLMSIVAKDTDNARQLANTKKVAALIIERYREMYRVFTDLDDATQKREAVVAFDRIMAARDAAATPAELAFKTGRCGFVGLNLDQDLPMLGQ